MADIVYNRRFNPGDVKQETLETLSNPYSIADSTITLQDGSKALLRADGSKIIFKR
jgi:hypothetical protein